MNAIFEFYNSADWHPIILLLGFWLFWPGTFFLVGYIGESRIIPIGRGQSVTFFPGDLSLGVVATAFIGIAANVQLPWDWPKGELWLIICLAIAAIIVTLMRLRFDAPNYPPRAAKSPTKWVHDLIGYGFFPFFYLWLGLPQMLYALSDHSSFRANWACWLVIFLAIFFFIGCIIADFALNHSISAVGDDALAMRHPSDWRPIWRKTATTEYDFHPEDNNQPVWQTDRDRKSVV